MAASIHQLRVRATDSAARENRSDSWFLTENLQRGFRTRALALLDQFFDAADDRLFEYVGRADGTGQLDYLQTMRKLRLAREPARGRFRAAISEQLRPGWRPHAVAKTEAQDGDLKLIEDKFVEQWSAVETTRRRIQSSCEEVLFKFKQSLEDARRRVELELLDFQFAPGAICFALFEGLKEIDVDAGQLVVVLKIFEQVACANLPTVYEELSQLLATNGVPNQSSSPKEPGTPEPAAGRKAGMSDVAVMVPDIVTPAQATANSVPGVAVPSSAVGSAIHTITSHTAAIEALLRLLRTAECAAICRSCWSR